jgi:hypothetical protein
MPGPLRNECSINHGDLWGQRRALLAYFNNATSPLYLHMRFLKDGTDFASAYLNSAQEKGLVAGAVTFFTDGGDTHISLGMVKKATVSASDLRLRFELGGDAAAVAAAKVTVSAANGSAVITAGGVSIKLLVPYARLDALSGRVVSGSVRGLQYVDVELYKGTARAFSLGSMQEAAVGFVLSIEPLAAPLEEVKGGAVVTDAAQAQGLRLMALPTKDTSATGPSPVLTISSSGLKVSVPIKPLSVATRRSIDSAK